MDELAAFAGMMRVHCPTRGNDIYMRVVDKLVRQAAVPQLVAILTNEVNGFPLYEGSLHGCVWMPTGFAQARKIRDIVGQQKLEKIEEQHRKDKRTRNWVYRDSDVANRHGHCNSNPWNGHKKLFTRYDDL